MLDQLAVFPQRQDHGLDGLLGRGCCQAGIHRCIQRLGRDPFDHIHNILKVVIKCLAADAAGLHQFFHSDLIHGFLFQSFGQRLGDHLFHIHRHGITPFALF